MTWSPQKAIGIAVMPLYLLATVAVGWFSRRPRGSANNFLNASHSLPLPLVSAAYLAANCGALEMVGLSAFAAQYGIQALQFYFIGAIPAMVFLAIWMMPVYARSGVTSVPAYVEQRFGPGMRLVNACVTGCAMLLLGGVSLYAMAQVLAALAGIRFVVSVLLCAGVVLTYVLLGGLRATIYNEVLQLGVMLVGLVPLTVHIILSGSLERFSETNQQEHLWHGMPTFDRGASGGDVFGWVVGLGFVLSFSYWCTDFVLMQRAFTAKSEYQARQVPLWAGFGKLIFAAIVVVPGLAAMRLIAGLGATVRPDQALPRMMSLSYGPALLGVGVTAIAASLMSGLSANASGFASIWTEEIYRPFLAKARPETHYVAVGRAASVLCVSFSALASCLNFLFGNMMEHVQLIFSITGAPFWAIFLVGMATRRATGRGAIIGLLSGIGVSLVFLFATIAGWLHYGSRMSANLHLAVIGFVVALAVSYGASLLWPIGQPSVPSSLVFQWKRPRNSEESRLWTLALLLLSVCVALNIWLR